MIANPVASPIFWPIAMAVMAALALGLAGVLAARRELRSTLLRRWGSWLCIAILYGGCVLAGPLPLLLLVWVLALQASREYAAMVGLPAAYTSALLIAATTTIAAVSLGAGPAVALVPLALIGVPLIAERPWGGSDLGRERAEPGPPASSLAFTVLGWAYIALPLAHLYLAQGHPSFLVALAFAVAASDIGAYVTGSFFGRHALAPAVSPRKTWEGVAGNVAGAYGGMAVAAFAMPGHIPNPALWLLPLAISAAAVSGDLAESFLKRSFGVKDTGSWFPGFGGLLDRIDSFLFALPVGYYLWLLLAQ